MFKDKSRMSEPDINKLTEDIENLRHKISTNKYQIDKLRAEIHYLSAGFQKYVIFPRQNESLKNTDLNDMRQLLLGCQYLCSEILVHGSFFNDVNVSELHHRIITALWKNITNKSDPESEEK